MNRISLDLSIILTFILYMIFFVSNTIIISVSGNIIDVDGWYQTGKNIYGDTNSFSGWSVSTSHNGNIVAISGTGSDYYTGSVQVYQYLSSTSEWRQLGNDIVGRSEYDSSGWSIDLSGDGLTVAVGSIFKDVSSDRDVGMVQVFICKGTEAESWFKLGDNIIGEHNDDRFGSSVSLSVNGRIIAIGSPYHDQHRGKASVYLFEDSSMSWIKVGTDMLGNKIGDAFGHSVSISGNGRTLAVGAPYSKSRSGRVYIFNYISMDESWTQVGYNVNGLADDDCFGWSVSISKDGYTFATSAIFRGESDINAGQVSVYSRKHENGILSDDWFLVGKGINGKSAYDEFGRSVSLSSDGLTVAVGAPKNYAYGNGRGYVQVYHYDTVENSWGKVGIDITGEETGDESGSAIALSGDGTTLVVGARWNNEANLSAGQTRIFDYKTVPSARPSMIPSSVPSILPTSTPSMKPSVTPSRLPSSSPSLSPTSMPSSQPTSKPSSFPTARPSVLPSASPSLSPTSIPSFQPTSKPSSFPSAMPSALPSSSPSISPTSIPTDIPSALPSTLPSITPSSTPTSRPSTYPTYIPSMLPSITPSSKPTSRPSTSPTLNPSTSPLPTSQPSFSPTIISSFVIKIETKNLCLQPYSLNDGSYIKIQTCNYDDKQKWSMDKYGQLRSIRNNKKCLKVHETDSSLVIGICSKNGSDPNTRFQYKPNLKKISWNKNKVLTTVQNKNTSNGSNVIVIKWKGQTNQKWVLLDIVSPTSTPSGPPSTQPTRSLDCYDNPKKLFFFRVGTKINGKKVIRTKHCKWLQSSKYKLKRKVCKMRYTSKLAPKWLKVANVSCPCTCQNIK